MQPHVFHEPAWGCKTRGMVSILFPQLLLHVHPYTTPFALVSVQVVEPAELSGPEPAMRSYVAYLPCKGIEKGMFFHSGNSATHICEPWPKAPHGSLPMEDYAFRWHEFTHGAGLKNKGYLEHWLPAAPSASSVFSRSSRLLVKMTTTGTSHTATRTQKIAIALSAPHLHIFRGCHGIKHL